jgi:hypothetical protein
MSAEIIPFPKKIKLKRFKSVDLYHCWDRRLDNPLLNSLYKPEVSYVELSSGDYTLDLLVLLIEKDMEVQRQFTNGADTSITDYNLARLNKWRIKFQGLLQYRHRLYNS